MAIVTAQMVKELRDMTLAGMSDCKKALDAAEGDIQKAIVILRERGLASAAKKASRVAAEGVVATVVENNNLGFAFEVNCETDFVTNNEHFQKFVNNIKNSVQQHKHHDLDALLKAPYEATTTIKDATVALIAQIGENINVRRFVRVGDGTTYVHSYVHGNGRIGVLVELAATNLDANNPALADIGRDVALQIAAMKPQYVNESAVPADVVKSEEDIIRNKFIAQGKPEAALAKIIPSSLKTWFKEVCLNDQLFVKDDSKTLAAHVTEAGKKIGINDLLVKSFVRLELGEGVDKNAAE